MSEFYAAERLALSLSPAGTNATRPVRISPELIAHHERQARRMRAEAFACWARLVWNVVTRRAAKRGGNCADEILLRPATVA